jgi:hypothetical protein
MEWRGFNDRPIGTSASGWVELVGVEPGSRPVNGAAWRAQAVEHLTRVLWVRQERLVSRTFSSSQSHSTSEELVRLKEVKRENKERPSLEPGAADGATCPTDSSRPQRSSNSRIPLETPGST